MNELRSRGERAALLPFFPDTGDALLLSALQGYLGRAFRSDRGDACLVLARDFIFLGGAADGAFFREAAGAFPARFLTFSGSEEWLSIPLQSPGAFKMTRWALAVPACFDVDRLRLLARPPAAFTLARADAALYGRCLAQGWSEDLVSAFPSAGEFAENGLAVLALFQGEIAAGCGAYARADGQMEVEIDTRPDFRRRGLATACGARFLLECLGRGLSPHWDAMTEISRALAEKLGFRGARPYSVVCWEGE